MARQSSTPVQFKRSVRKDRNVLMTSGRAGVVIPLGYAPLLAGDSCAGRVAFDIELAEMPKPLLNGVTANVQVWFVPKPAFPRFPGMDEFYASYTKTPIKAMGQAGGDRAATKFYFLLDAPQTSAIDAAPLFSTMGIHRETGTRFNTDLIDACALIYNFRLAAHSSKLTRVPYVGESPANFGGQLQGHHWPAFWPSSRFSKTVPDYERALTVGSLDLDVAAGRLPVSGIGFRESPTLATASVYRETNGAVSPTEQRVVGNSTDIGLKRVGDAAAMLPDIYAEMAGQGIQVTLADIDKARVTQSFAKLRTAYAGNDTSGFENDDALVAMLMQGVEVDRSQNTRPWLLDSKRVVFGMAERHATDAANLDQSVTQGRVSVTISANVPRQDVTGYIVYTLEVLPERIDERMSDEALYLGDPDELPNALRDVQRPEPVDMVLNRRVDVKHATPAGLYGYEPMNEKWNRDFTRLGGIFYSPNPAAGFTESRANIWHPAIVNPAFGKNHYLAPAPFPHDVFADTEGPAFEVVVRHDFTIQGNTQFGDVLAEHNGDYLAVQEA